MLISGHLDLSIDSILALAPGIAMLLATKWIRRLISCYLYPSDTLVGALMGYFNGVMIAHVRKPFYRRYRYKLCCVV